MAKANAHSQGSEALSLAEWRLRLAMSQNRRRARVKLGGNEQCPPAHHLHALVTLPLHGSRLLIYRVSTPSYIAAGHHIWWSFPYPPPGDVVGTGSLQLGPIKTLGKIEQHHIEENVSINCVVLFVQLAVTSMHQIFECHVVFTAAQ